MWGEVKVSQAHGRGRQQTLLLTWPQSDTKTRLGRGGARTLGLGRPVCLLVGRVLLSV